MTQTKDFSAIDTGIFPVDFALEREGDQQVYPEDYRQREREVEVYALVPFANNAITLKSSLNSLTPTISKGVLVYPELGEGIQDDQSLAIATAFVQENPGFKLVKYPVPVIPPTSSWLASKLFAGGVSVYWLYHELLNFGLVNLKFLVEANQDQDKAWLFVASPETIYAQGNLQVLKTKVEAQNLQYDVFKYQTLNYTLNHLELFKTGGFFRRFLKTLGLDGSEEVLYPEVVSKARLIPVQAPRELDLNYLIRLRNLKHFSYKYHKALADDSALLEAQGALVPQEAISNFSPEFVSQAQIYPQEFLLGRSFPFEARLAYQGDTAEHLAQFFKQELHFEVETQEQELDAQFWSQEGQEANLAQLAYPRVHRLLRRPQKVFNTYDLSLETLLGQSKYRMEEWLNGFNLRLGQNNLTEIDRLNLRAQAQILQSFFNSYNINPQVL
ncbi:hypothetical protein [Psittacicella gerlachiana]|uniref:Uncharacterized protein n=1 Tax=Psittacicella gerlachiana TaxID=2028574 RepID=A0A3A1YK16_9GAMM|nr:hypothetical protein [Psittacicella gerlachiana]RIY37931.1 hypothetical protein CKF59_01205 [Psittacicella gerlachiana]